MPQVKKKNNVPAGCLEIQLPSKMLQNICDMEPGRAFILDGKSQAGSRGSQLCEDVRIEVCRREESVCLLLFASLMGSVFKKKLCKHWLCQLSNCHTKKRHQDSVKLTSTRKGKCRKSRGSALTIEHAAGKDVAGEDVSLMDSNYNMEDLWNQDLSEQTHGSNNPREPAPNYSVKVEPDGSCVGEIAGGSDGSTKRNETVSEVTADRSQRRNGSDWSQVQKTEFEQSESMISQQEDGNSALDKEMAWADELEKVKHFCERSPSHDDGLGILSSETSDVDKKQGASGVNDDGSKDDDDIDDGDDDDDDDDNSEGSRISDCEDGVERSKCLTGVSCIFCDKNYSHVANPQLALERHLLRKCTRNPWSRDSVAPMPTVCEKYPLGCIHCPKAFDTEKRLQSHQERCPRNPEYMAKFDKDSLNLKICEICDRLFANEKALMSHKVMNHGYPRSKDVPTKYPCRYCQMLFNCRGTRYHHETYKCNMNPNVAQLTYCRICDRKMAKEKLDDHMKESHTKMERCMCEKCGAVFPSSRRLYTHKYAHKEKMAKFSCDICGRKFKLKYQMERHLTTHTDERNVQCPVCGKCFKNKDQERDHRLAVHEGRYKYRCNKCGHGMAKKIYLDNHRCGRVRRIQDGERLMKFSEAKKLTSKSQSGPVSKSRELAEDEQIIRPSYFILPEAVYQNAAPISHEQPVIQQNFLPPHYENFMAQTVQPAVQSLQSSVQSAQPPVQSMHLAGQSTVQSLTQSSSQPLVQPHLPSSLQCSLQSSMQSLQSAVLPVQSSLYQTAHSILGSSAHLNTQQMLQPSLQPSVAPMIESSLQATVAPMLQSSV